MQYLSEIFQAEQRYRDAELLERNVLKEERKRSGACSPKALRSQCHLASILSDQGRIIHAEKLQKRALKRCSRRFGSDNPCTLLAMRNLSKIYMKKGESERAEKLLLRLVQRQLERPQDHYYNLVCDIVDLILAKALRGELGQAMNLTMRLLARIEDLPEEIKVPAIQKSSKLIAKYLECGAYEMADEITAITIAQLTSVIDSNDPELGECVEEIASFYNACKRYNKASEIQMALYAVERMQRKEMPHQFSEQAEVTGNSQI